MAEHLNLLKELLIIDNNRDKILELIQESYITNRKYLILSYFFDQTRKVVDDLEKIKKHKISKTSILMSKVFTYDIIDENNFPTIEREILKKYKYYYTALMISNSIRNEKSKETFRYIFTSLLTIISIILAFIASIISKL